MNDSERLQLLEDAEVLYEADIGPVDFEASPTLPLRQGAKAGMKDSKRAFIAGEDEDERKKVPAKRRYEEDGLDEESYASEFGFLVSGTHFDEKEKSVKLEYRLLPERDVKKSQEADAAPRHETGPAVSRAAEEFMQLGAAENVAYSVRPSIEKYAQDVLGPNAKTTYDSGVLNIEYRDVELINGQKTYQRVVFKAEREGESVYDLTVRKLGEAGMKVKAVYDSEFDSMLFTSINDREEGADGNFNEFYVNGEIGTVAADQARLKGGDTIEIRYAAENKGDCGGSPDFNAIRSMLEYSTVARMQAEYFGILHGRPSFSQPGNGYGSLIFH